MCPIRAETFRLYFAYRRAQVIPKGDEVYAKVLAASWKTAVDTFLTALFRGVTTFPQHFQKYLLLQREPRGAGKGSRGQARRDLQRGCN